MSTNRTYSKYTRDAAALLGRLIKLGRKRRGWSELELAERTGVARATIQRIERGDPACSLGLAFEAAALVGVPLFDADDAAVSALKRQTDGLLTLMPKAVRKRAKDVDDDF